MARTPRTRAMPGLAGVLGTLVTATAPDAVSTETISVKVPPVSIPIRKRALLMACAMVTLGCSRKPAGCLAWFVTQKKRRERAAIRSSVCINRRGPDRIGRNEKRPAVADGAFVIRNGLSRACRWAHRRGGLPRRPQVLPDRLPRFSADDQG